MKKLWLPNQSLSNLLKMPKFKIKLKRSNPSASLPPMNPKYKKYKPMRYLLSRRKRRQWRSQMMNSKNWRLNKRETSVARTMSEHHSLLSEKESKGLPVNE